MSSTTSGVKTATTHPLSDLHWPAQGLQPDAVLAILHRALGTGAVPIYLPQKIPAGFSVREKYILKNGSGGVSNYPNPQSWPGNRAGYSLYLWNGKDYISLSVNFPGDVGLATWLDTGIPFEGGSLRRIKDAAFVAGVGAGGANIVINGCQTPYLRDQKYLREVLEIAEGLVRVE